MVTHKHNEQDKLRGLQVQKVVTRCGNSTNEKLYKRRTTPVCLQGDGKVLAERLEILGKE